MADEFLEMVGFDAPGFEIATVNMFAPIKAAYEAEGHYQNAFNALMFNLALLVDDEQGDKTSNRELRERCEELGRAVHRQVRAFRDTPGFGPGMMSYLSETVEQHKKATPAPASVQ